MKNVKDDNRNKRGSNVRGDKYKIYNGINNTFFNWDDLAMFQICL